ncbi:hypothetical protein B9Z55_014827 [Caenorhabditis nigoni]|uniref:SUN domain-containing protein n=1 Tax=Caenorhabditis nigoni TaxID=1611254 RepID=A0A2G5U7G6_9PELO|nr:hypothetical protein B9Z55_014827 [Caenorhabditis nigoni]
MKPKFGSETKPFLEDVESSKPPNPFQFKKNEYYGSQKPILKEQSFYRYVKFQVFHQPIVNAVVALFAFLILVQIYSDRIRIFELEQRLYNVELQLNSVPREDSHHVIQVIQETTKKVITDIPPTSKPSKQISNKTSEFNAASLILGATVETGLSSNAVPTGDGFFDKISFKLGSDQSGYVLLDRDPIPAGKAWCSTEKNPVLTVKLAENITPIAVSYQHSKWNGTLPAEAPMSYDVVACINENCNVTVALVSNCNYSSSENEQEQKCQISNTYPLVNRVQFRFNKNHGNSSKTCLYLIRVYGEAKEDVRNQKEDNIELKKSRAGLCSRLAWFHKKIPIFYNGLASKNCTTLYSNDCCDECPECCAECQINDGDFLNNFQFILIFFVLFFILFPIYIAGISACCILFVNQTRVARTLAFFVTTTDNGHQYFSHRQIQRTTDKNLFGYFSLLSFLNINFNCLVNGRTTDGQRTVNGRSTDGQRTVNGRTTDGQRADNGRTTGGQRADNGRTTGGQRADNGRTTDGQRTVNGRTTDGQRTANGRTTGGQRADNGRGQRTVNGRTTDGQRTDNGRSTGGKRADNGRPTGGQRAANGRTTGGQRTVNGRTTGGQRADNGRTTGGQRADNGRTTDGQRTDNRRTTGGQRTGNGRTTDGQQADNGRTTDGQRTANIYWKLKKTPFENSSLPFCDIYLDNGRQKTENGRRNY